MENDRFNRAVYVISVAAELSGMHPQTLRIYERKGLVEPERTGGGSRRYSDADIALLSRIQQLTNEGLNLAGVKRVLDLKLGSPISKPGWSMRSPDFCRGCRGHREHRRPRSAAAEHHDL